MAYENENGMITWQDFIPVGIEAIKSFLDRNKALAKLVSKQGPVAVELNKSTLKFLYEKEVEI